MVTLRSTNNVALVETVFHAFVIKPLCRQATIFFCARYTSVTLPNVHLNQTSGVANLFASRCHAVSSMQSGCR